MSAATITGVRTSTDLAPALSSPALAEPAWVRRLLIGLAVGFLLVLLVAPLVLVLAQAFSKGVGAYLGALRTPDALAALRLTLTAAAIAVPLNCAFGLAAAWALGKFQFRGRGALITLIDLPFAVSPVIAGLVLVLLFGRQGLLGPYLVEQGFQVVFAVPGIVLATIFVTVPFVAREVLHVMETQGADEEVAGRLMGASGLQLFRLITLPNVRWGLLYGVILCNARAMGEFGAVSVVSGHIRGRTNTLPLHVEILYHEYQFSAAFAVASMLVGLAVLTLIAKTWLEARGR